jgi:hypothetical protein
MDPARRPPLGEAVLHYREGQLLKLRRKGDADVDAPEKERAKGVCVISLLQAC